MAEDTSCAYEPDGTIPLVAARAVSYGSAQRERALPWTADAESRLARVPGFVRSVVAERVENFARERGYEAITAEIMDEVRRSMPVDFSKRLPYFMRGGKA